MGEGCRDTGSGESGGASVAGEPGRDGSSARSLRCCRRLVLPLFLFFPASFPSPHPPSGRRFLPRCRSRCLPPPHPAAAEPRLLQTELPHEMTTSWRRQRRTSGSAAGAPPPRPRARLPAPPAGCRLSPPCLVGAGNPAWSGHLCCGHGAGSLVGILAMGRRSEGGGGAAILDRGARCFCCGHL